MSKELIVESSKNLFMKYGIKSISMDDISKELGMSKKTLYNYITNKDDLVSEVLKSFTDAEKVFINDLRETAKNAIEEMAGIGRYVLQHMRQMKPTLTFDLKKYYPSAWIELSNTHFPFIEKTIQENIIKGKSEGFYRPDIDELIISKIYVGMARMLVDQDVFPVQKFTTGDIYKSYFVYHMNGIMNEQGLKEFKKYINQEK